jgi:ribosomal protein S18 acetylase RimI-like enzyme
VGALRKIYVADLAIRQDARRMGLATKMLAEIENYCIREKYDEIYLHVEVDNFVARKLYQKLGYIELSQSDLKVISFTESRLQKNAFGFILLRKSILPTQRESWYQSTCPFSYCI